MENTWKLAILLLSRNYTVFTVNTVNYAERTSNSTVGQKYVNEDNTKLLFFNTQTSICYSFCF